MANKLRDKEIKVLEKYFKTLKPSKMKTKSSFIIGMVGLPGTKRREVAEGIAKRIGATLVSADDIRVELDKKNLSYDNVREITWEITSRLLKKETNVLIESDHADAGKRNKLRKVAKDSDAKLIYVRVTCEADQMFENLIKEKHSRKNLLKNSVTAVKEAWRRTPLHYSWSKLKGGEWVEKNLAYAYAQIDTTYSSKVAKQIRKVASDLKSI